MERVRAGGEGVRAPCIFALAGTMAPLSETVSKDSELDGLRDLHEGVVDRDHEYFAGFFELGGVDVAGDMILRAGGREGGWHA